MLYFAYHVVPFFKRMIVIIINDIKYGNTKHKKKVFYNKSLCVACFVFNVVFLFVGNKDRVNYVCSMYNCVL